MPNEHQTTFLRISPLNVLRNHPKQAPDSRSKQGRGSRAVLIGFSFFGNGGGYDEAGVISGYRKTPFERLETVAAGLGFGLSF